MPHDAVVDLLTARDPRAAAHTGDGASTVSQLSELAGLPRLNYNLWDHKKKLFIVSSLLIIESSILPIVLFYAFWYGTGLRHGIIFAIITSFFGLVTGIEFALRSWKLILKTDKYRPLGGRRWKFDFTHFTLSFGYTYMTGILIGASIPHEPLVRPLALPAPLFFFQLGIQLLVTSWMHHTHRPAPFRISSWAKGDRTPLLVYTLVEDIVAVDGSAGKEYRQRLMARYKISPKFRLMLAQLNWFWGIGALLDGAGTIVLLFTLDERIAYGVGWGSPLIFATIWTIITVHWTRRCLLQEKLAWRAEKSPVALAQRRGDNSQGYSTEGPESSNQSRVDGLGPAGVAADTSAAPTAAHVVDPPADAATDATARP